MYRAAGCIAEQPIDLWLRDHFTSSACKSSAKQRDSVPQSCRSSGKLTPLDVLPLPPSPPSQPSHSLNLLPIVRSLSVPAQTPNSFRYELHRAPSSLPPPSWRQSRSQPSSSLFQLSSFPSPEQTQTIPHWVHRCRSAGGCPYQPARGVLRCRSWLETSFAAGDGRMLGSLDCDERQAKCVVAGVERGAFCGFEATDRKTSKWTGVRQVR